MADGGDGECPAWCGVPDAMNRMMLKLINRVPEEDENEEHKYQDRRDGRNAMRNVSNLLVHAFSASMGVLGLHRVNTQAAWPVTRYEGVLRGSISRNRVAKERWTINF